MTRRTQRVWIVEVRWRDKPEQGWKPTVGCALTKMDGQSVLRNWQDHNPSDRFRLVPYRGMKRQCQEEIKLEGIPWSTFRCIKREGHLGPHTISVLGSDVLHEALMPDPTQRATCHRA